MAKKKKASPKVAEKTTTPEVEPAYSTEVEKKKVVEYVVAEGLSITSRRGVLTGGAVVSPRDFPGGEATIIELVQKRHLVKKK